MVQYGMGNEPLLLFIFAAGHLNGCESVTPQSDGKIEHPVDTPVRVIKASAVPETQLKVEYKTELKRDSAGLQSYKNCEESVELRADDMSLVSDAKRGNFVQAEIVVGSCKGFCLNVYNTTFLRDGIRMSKDSILSIVPKPRPMANASAQLDNMTVSITVQFLDATTVNITLRVEATNDETKWNETHVLLQIPELHLLSTFGLRPRHQYESGVNCIDQLTLLTLEMDTPGSSNIVLNWIIAVVLTLTVLGIIALCYLGCQHFDCPLRTLLRYKTVPVQIT